MFVNWLISGMVYIFKLIEWISTFIFITLFSVNSYPVCPYHYINQLNTIFLPYSSLVFLFLYHSFELSILLATFLSSCSSLFFLFLTFPLTNAVHSWKFMFLPSLFLSLACCLSYIPPSRICRPRQSLSLLYFLIPRYFLRAYISTILSAGFTLALFLSQDTDPSQSNPFPFPLLPNQMLPRYSTNLSAALMRPCRYYIVFINNKSVKMCDSL